MSTKPNTTEIAFILDQSGSMAAHTEVAIASFNEVLREQQDVDGIATATARKMTTPGKKNFTVISFDDSHYDVGISEEIFSERYLKSPPGEFIN